MGFWAFLSWPSLAVPKYTTTNLPISHNINADDQRLLKAALDLQVQQDDKDPNQYYYLPPFHIRQYKQGAAGMLLHVYNIKQFSAAENELRMRVEYAKEYTRDELKDLKQEKLLYDEKVAQANEKLDEAEEKGNKDAIARRKSWLERMQGELAAIVKKINEAEEIIKAGNSLLPAGLGRSYFEKALLYLATAGNTLSVNPGDDPSLVSAVINKAIQDLGESYGGFMSFNAYAGFTEDQLDALRMYKTKYAPHIKISLMPIDELTFFPLTEQQVNKQSNVLNTKMFRNVQGAGDYLGAQIVMDTTITGSFGLAQHLQPFLLPVGIQVNLRVKYEPSEFNLLCDFTTGFSVNGRADIRDGLIIFDNDLTNKISAYDKNFGNCNIERINGDKNSAEYKALEELSTFYEKMHIQRTHLSYQEKKKYYDAVLADLERNRRSSDSDSISNPFFIWWDIFNQAFVGATDFHWHTSIHDIENISQTKFDKHIYVSGHEKVEKKIPVNLCLVYNAQKNAYDKCVPAEELAALNMNHASNNAKYSKECSNAFDPFECAKNRDEAGLTTPSTDRTYVNDNLLVNGI
jgi:hypothetical protein